MGPHSSERAWGASPWGHVTRAPRQLAKDIRRPDRRQGFLPSRKLGVGLGPRRREVVTGECAEDPRFYVSSDGGLLGVGGLGAPPTRVSLSGRMS